MIGDAAAGLAQQGGLADAGLAGHEQRAGPPVDGPLHQVQHRGQLAGTPHERPAPRHPARHASSLPPAASGYGCDRDEIRA